MNNEELIRKLKIIKNNLYSTKEQISSAKAVMNGSINIGDTTFKSSELVNIINEINNEIHVVNQLISRCR